MLSYTLAKNPISYMFCSNFISHGSSTCKQPQKTQVNASEDAIALETVYIEGNQDH